jgi:hypothetical protein
MVEGIRKEQAKMAKMKIKKQKEDAKLKRKNPKGLLL